ncbi:KR domain-containing protein [Catenulispora rubra]|uniref:KR domain-containing protein n=1 Tax=Catenulispora rubra TaxID=280293 RepID=UPI002B26C285|nr:KR domain-containing protein [Catenulispora rubra]
MGDSRSLGFVERFAGVRDRGGFDVVVNSLAGDFVDASLGLLRRGGRFVELGRTDVRDAGRVAEEFAGVVYQAFDLLDAGLDRIGEMLGELRGLAQEGLVGPGSVSVWDVRRAGEALRFLSRARHVGKVVLSVPAPLPTSGSVVVSGGTGVLGGLVARRLVQVHGVRSLILVGRQGLGVPGMSETVQALEALGATVTVVAADVAERSGAQAVLDAVPAGSSVTGVVHAAGVLDDGVVGSLSRERLDGVLGPKVDGGWWLHELTARLDLEAFVAFSSAVGTVGGAGQAAYAAGNAFLDALMTWRQSRGLPGVSLAWGLWEQSSEMTKHLSSGDIARMGRIGAGALSTDEGLTLFDRLWRGARPVVVPMRLDVSALRRRAAAGEAVPAVFSSLAGSAEPTGSGVAVGRAGAGAGAGGSWADRLAELGADERQAAMADLVRAQVAAALGHGSGERVALERPFKDLGLDSLTAVELRNRLSSVTGVRLPASLVFDHPSPRALTTHLLTLLAPPEPDPVDRILSGLTQIEALFAEEDEKDLGTGETRASIDARVRSLLRAWNGICRPDAPDGGTEQAPSFESASDDELFEAFDTAFGRSESS